MTESQLKSAFMRTLKEKLPGAVALRHEDIRTGGIPDLSVTLYGKTSWWEFKHCNPKMITNGLQELTCLRLAAAGYCRYVMWWESKDGTVKKTLIVHPKHIGDLEADASCRGFDHTFIVNFISVVHQP